VLGSDEYFVNRAGGTIAGFVQALNQDVTGGTLDAATLASVTQQLVAGTSRTQVALGVLGTPQARIFQVQGYSQRFLNQAADPLTLATAVAALNAGVSDQVVIAAFVASV
jgi:hypothetical protein